MVVVGFRFAKQILQQRDELQKAEKLTLESSAWFRADWCGKPQSGSDWPLATA
jgi:hypothetical protein